MTGLSPAAATASQQQLQACRAAPRGSVGVVRGPPVWPARSAACHASLGAWALGTTLLRAGPPFHRDSESAACPPARSLRPQGLPSRLLANSPVYLYLCFNSPRDWDCCSTLTATATDWLDLQLLTGPNSIWDESRSRRLSCGGSLSVGFRARRPTYRPPTSLFCCQCRLLTSARDDELPPRVSF